MRNFLVGILVFLLATLLIACGSDDKKDENDEAVGTTVAISDEEKVEDEAVVAVINGEDVNGTTYNLVYSQLKLHSGQMNEEVDIEEVKEAAMDSIIDRQLLMQEARKEGIEITDETANSEFDTIKSENSEALSTLLEQYQITEAGFKEQLKFELIMNEYMAKAIEVSVTDEEVEEYYEKAKEGNDEIPEFDEIKSQLKKNLLQQKTQEALQEKIDHVKEKAEIKKKI